MLQLAEQLNIPTKITIIDVQPYDLSFGNKLSVEIQNSIDKILSAIQSVIK